MGWRSIPARAGLTHIEARATCVRRGRSPRAGLKGRSVSGRRRDRGREGAVVPERRPVGPPEREVADVSRGAGDDQAPCGAGGSAGVEVLSLRSGRRASRRICRTGYARARPTGDRTHRDLRTRTPRPG